MSFAFSVQGREWARGGDVKHAAVAALFPVAASVRLHLPESPDRVASSRTRETCHRAVCRSPPYRDRPALLDAERRNSPGSVYVLLRAADVAAAYLSHRRDDQRGSAGARPEGDEQCGRGCGPNLLACQEPALVSSR
ncbi:hypothetical protein HPB50_024154 [Hyalomma asiaticum]|uniref:Uncharacterized protein n=1 Tax=Hyalomma asiaticum TaxID=266040 RepID=A0ACB7SQQ4_HYAAI|nr:hypothetical protein HPB50_024154 [Hyalomma asiaticum]